MKLQPLTVAALAVLLPTVALVLLYWSCHAWYWARRMVR